MKAKFEFSELDETRSLIVMDLDLEAFDAPWHFHPELELTYIIEGTGERFVGDSVEPFAAGDLVLLGSKVPHYWQSKTVCEDQRDTGQSSPPRAKAIVFHFRGNFVDSFPELNDARQLLNDKCVGGLKFKNEQKVVEKILEFQNLDPRFRVPKFLELLTELSTMTYQSLSTVHANRQLDMKAS